MTSIYSLLCSVAGGNYVYINGTNLGDATAVYFGQAAGSIFSVSATQLDVLVPASSPGTVDVTVAASGVTSPTTPAVDGTRTWQHL